MKKFFCFSLTIIFCAISVFAFSGCSKNEVDKISKNLTVYSISAELNAENMTVSGSQSVDYFNETGTELSYLCFHLYPRAFREGAMLKPYTILTAATCFPNGISYGDIQISAVRVNGENSAFEHIGEDEDILKVNFNFGLANGKRVKIDIDFNLSLPNSTHRLGYYQTNINLGNFYPVACKFEGGKFDLTPYYSTGDPFYSDIANFNVSFTYPSKYTLCSTGSITVGESNNKKVATINAKAVRDFAMCLSDNAGLVSTKAGNTTIYYMGYKDDQDLNKQLSLSKAAVEYFGKVFGAYPYSTLSVVKTPFIYGGMEYPNIVFISDAIDDEDEYLKVVVHEIAHQWWYGVVGNNEAREAWLDESLTEYSAALFFANNTGYGISYKDLVDTALSSYLLYVDVISAIKGDVNTKMNLAVNEYQNDYEYSYMVYVKGVIMFDALRNVVGEDKLISGFKKYYQQNKFKNATKDDFFAAFKSACHKDLDGFFDGYLNGTTIITKLS